MTGETTLLGFVFGIGFFVFGLAFVGGMIVMRSWWKTTNPL